LSSGLLVNAEFSDYIVYVDESGDHNLERINPEYPLFVLAFCIFEKKNVRKSNYFEYSIIQV